MFTSRFSNSTWIAEDTPCITYGLRGVIHCKVQVCMDSHVGNMACLLESQISSSGPDLHSGVDGGAVVEPMMDMCVHPVYFTLLT